LSISHRDHSARLVVPRFGFGFAGVFFVFAGRIGFGFTGVSFFFAGIGFGLGVSFGFAGIGFGLGVSFGFAGIGLGFTGIIGFGFDFARLDIRPFQTNVPKKSDIVPVAASRDEFVQGVLAQLGLTTPVACRNLNGSTNHVVLSHGRYRRRRVWPPRTRMARHMWRRDVRPAGEPGLGDRYHLENLFMGKRKPSRTVGD